MFCDLSFSDSIHSFLCLTAAEYPDVVKNPPEIDNQDEDSPQRSDDESTSLTEESNILPPIDSESEITEGKSSLLCFIHLYIVQPSPSSACKDYDLLDLGRNAVLGAA